MKRILGLDLGVSSVGWALVLEDKTGVKEIENLGVRIVPEDPNFHGKFYEGNTASKNEDRRTKRSIRRNNQRFKLRRDRLKRVLISNQMYPSKDLLDLDKLDLYRLRAEGVTKKLSLNEFGRVLIHLNHKRGFWSNRKAQSEEDNSTDYKKRLSENEEALNGLTIGEYNYKRLKQDLHFRTKGKVYLRKTYIEEFNRLWNTQKSFHPEILSGDATSNVVGSLYHEIKNKTIFFQRPLKSQKHLISHCTFETNHRVVPKSSPLFQVFRVYQQVNNLSYIPYGEHKSIDLNEDQRRILVEALLNPKVLNKKGILSRTKVISLLGYKKGSLNYEELIGDQTKKRIYDVADEANFHISGDFFEFDPLDKCEGQYMRLWHILYSLDKIEDVMRALEKHFEMSEEQAYILASKVGFSSDYGSLSSRAIRKLIPGLMAGLTYDKACDVVGYDHSGYKTEVEHKATLDLVHPNELRNPVVEQVLNQMINVVNAIIKKYGEIDEIVVEMARELKNSAKTRKRISSSISKNTKVNAAIRTKLHDEFGFSMVNGRDVKRYKLWQETGGICLYCLNNVSQTDLLNGNADIEHIIPKSRSYNDSLNNKIVTHAKCNRDKGQLSALDYMVQRDSQLLEAYHNEVQKLYDDGNISPIKYKNLLTRGEDIESGFLSRQMKDTQFIVVESVNRLKTICSSVRTTTGSITDLLRDQWKLNHVLQELVLPVYEKLNMVETKKYKDAQGGFQEYRVPIGWSKREDHRHHAVDALITALTDQKVIFKLNNLNKIFQYKKGLLDREGELELLDSWRGLGLDASSFNLKSFVASQSYNYSIPIVDLRKKAKKFLSNVIVSTKKQSKAVSPKTNRIKTKEGVKKQKTLVPRGSLHNDTIHGRIKVSERVKLSPRFSKVDQVVLPHLKDLLTIRLKKYGDPKKAFSVGAMKDDPILWKGKTIDELDVFVFKYTKRVSVASLTMAQVKKIVDKRIKELVEDRIRQKGSLTKATESFVEEPLFLDKSKIVPVKTLTVFDEGNLVSVRENDFGPVDFAYTAGNHHVRIYKDQNDKYHDRVISLWDALADSTIHFSETGKVVTAIDRRDLSDEGLKFVYDLQKNDFVIIDLDLSILDINELQNRELISQHLFRVQKFSKEKSGAFRIDFRHHLETSVTRTDNELRGITWERFQSNGNFRRLSKIQLNNLGEIIAVHFP